MSKPTEILASLEIFELLHKSSEFVNWLHHEFPKAPVEEVFWGYHFAVNSCLNLFLNELIHDSYLGIKNSFLLSCASSELKPLHSLDNTCKKIILLKNIQPLIKNIKRAKSFEEVDRNCQIFNDQVAYPLKKLLEKHLVISNTINIHDAKKMLLINFVHTYFFQIGCDGPYANARHTMNTSTFTVMQKHKTLIGYAHSMQFLWNQILGDSEYRKTKLTYLHLVISWNEYSFDQALSEETTFFNRTFKLEYQKCLDSFFYWIQQDITFPLTKKFGFEIFNIGSYFNFEEKPSLKNSFLISFLSKKNLPAPKMETWEEKVHERLYWFEYEVVDSNNAGLFYGIPSFNTLLAGTVALHKKRQSQFSKIIVAKFTHPIPERGNHYSYGVLVDSKSAAGHYSSGWTIYLNVTSDYSGFASTEYRSAEAIIKGFITNRKVELRHLTIPLPAFEDIMGTHSRVPQAKNLIRNHKRELSAARGHLFELFAYWVCCNYYNGKKVQLNSGKNSVSGEKDVIVSGEQDVLIIECKFKVDDRSGQDIAEILRRKMQVFPETHTNAEIWVWKKITSQSVFEVFEKNGIKVIQMSNVRSDPRFRYLDMSNIRNSMDNTNN